jgi:hypothetical protein
MIEASGSYSYSGGFYNGPGQKVPDTSNSWYNANVRYTRYMTIGDHPVAFQISQGAAYNAAYEYDGYNEKNYPGGHSIGAQNTWLSALFWPYADAAAQTYVFTAAYLAPPRRNLLTQ